MPKELRGVRDLARKRMQLVQQRSVQILSIETQMDQQHGAHLAANLFKKLTCDEIDTMGLGEMEAMALKANLSVMPALNAQVVQIEKTLAKVCTTYPGFSLLKSVAGIGDALATVILLETGSIERFKDVGNYVSYCRCVGSVHTSNGKKKGEGNTKNGNRFLAWAYVEAANFAIRYSEVAKKFYQRKKAKRNGIIAIKAVAHKLARACFHMLKTGESFSVERCFT
ncbi:transposase [Undibacterium sp. Di27W]